MELHKTAYLATTLMSDHGLLDLGWYFEFTNKKNTFGSCNETRKRITVSKPLSLINDEAKVRDTILHEIAHALVGCKHGHDYVWKAKALEIGSNGQRCFDNTTAILVEGKYIAVCCGCGNKTHKHRKTKSISSCGKCSGGRYNEAFKLNFELNPNY